MTDNVRAGRRRQLYEAPPPNADHATESTEIEIDLVDLLYRLLDNAKYIILLAILCAGLTALFTQFYISPKYQATAKLYVVNSRDSAINLSDLQIGAMLTNDYQEVFNIWEVHEQVLNGLDLNYTYKQLRNMLSISNPSNTRILNITVTSLDPVEAAVIANKYATVAQTYINKTMSTETPNIMSAALEPTAPISPNKTRNTMLGFILGAMLASGIIAVRFMLDDKIKNADDIRKYVGIETLAVIRRIDDPIITGQNKAKRVKGGRA